MTKHIFTSLLIAFVLTACSDSSKNNKQAETKTVDSKGFAIVLENPASFDRPDEIVLISRQQLQSRWPRELPKDSLPQLQTSEGKNILLQTDDLDGDGNWDEIAFLYNFKSREKATVYLSFTTVDQQTETPRFAHAYLGYSPERNGQYTPLDEHTRPKDHQAQSTPFLYQFEGPGWENDKVGFRSYFDSRNGKDIFGKRTSKMCLDSIGLPGDNYHELDDWGMDVLKVGQSLGAGALAMLWQNNPVRLGKTDQAHFRLIADGPLRAIIELQYQGWHIDNTNYQLTDRITIWAGRYYYQSSLTLDGEFEGARKLLTGISLVPIKDTSYQPVYEELDNGWKLLATHAKQSENNDMLGMGILASNDESTYIGANSISTPNANMPDEVNQTAYMLIPAMKGLAANYYFFAGWEMSNPQFKSADYFVDYMKQEAARLNQPILLSKTNED